MVGLRYLVLMTVALSCSGSLSGLNAITHGLCFVNKSSEAYSVKIASFENSDKKVIFLNISPNSKTAFTWETDSPKKRTLYLIDDGSIIGKIASFTFYHEIRNGSISRTVSLYGESSKKDYFKSEGFEEIPIDINILGDSIYVELFRGPKKKGAASLP